MHIETFTDGSTIETDPATGNRTVIGATAHKAYFKRLEDERIQADTPVAVMAFCKDSDGTRKAELIRRRTENPITASMFGPYSWEVWTSQDPSNVTRYANEGRARKAFASACEHEANP